MVGSEDIPSEWSCVAEDYADGYFCDCDCGEVIDPDCDNFKLEVRGCESEFGHLNVVGKCLKGSCSYQKVPEDWTCDPSWYNSSNGCDCGCGVPDPDCSDLKQFIIGCEPGENCLNGNCWREDETNTNTSENEGGEEILTPHDHDLLVDVLFLCLSVFCIVAFTIAFVQLRRSRSAATF